MLHSRHAGASRPLALLLCLCVLLSCASCAPAAPVGAAGPVEALSANAGDNVLHAAVLYDGADNDGSWEDVSSRLAQSVVLGFDLTAVDVSDGALDLTGFDAVYPDVSLNRRPELAQIIEQFAADGGGVFVPNGLWDYFSPAFLGAKSFEALSGCPAEGMTFPKLGEDLSALQQIVSDFAELYTDYGNYAELAALDYGQGMVPDTAVTLAAWNGLSLYTMNAWGDGHVFFANPLLPNPYFITGFSVEARSGAQGSLSNTTATCSQLLENEFMAYLMKQRFGYSLSKVYGSYGRPNMSWELHYEEQTGMAAGAAELFAEAAMEYQQVPSYTLVRSSIWWWTRSEAVTYLLGQAGAPFSFPLDKAESVYSSGTHIAAGGKWVAIKTIENAGGYFGTYPQYGQRAYPYVCDLNGDGNLDLLSGCADGGISFYSGTGFTDRLTTAAPVSLSDEHGRPLTVGSYSAPVLAEVNGDGIPDLVCGAGDGKVYWFSGNSGLTFSYEGLFCNAHMGSQALPDVGDLNGDGCPDLILGSNSGTLEVWYGDRADRLHVTKPTAIEVPEEETGPFLAPRVVDFDGDGVSGLVVGTFQGYLMKLANRDGALQFDGYLTTDVTNYKGNNRLMFQNNCVPFFTDLNGDGVTDLVVGSLEYGLSYPIDSPYFPYREALQQTVDYLNDHEFYLGVHFLTGQYFTAEQELAELAAQREAFTSYGIDLTCVGANRHTWYSSVLDPKQTFLSEWRSGLLWDSGFAPAGTSIGSPQVSPENAVVYPFFLLDGDEQTLLVQNCSTVLYRDDTYALLSGKYEMPVCLFYHMDLNYKDPDATQANLQSAEAFRRSFAYNFAGEDQLMKASAAAIHMTAALTPDNGHGGLSFTVTAGSDGADYPLYDAHYANACGVKITFGEKLAGRNFATDADVWYRGDNGALYVGLNRPVRVYETEQAGETAAVPHIQQINTPADITATGEGAEISFHEGGMMQLTVAGSASTDSTGWSVETIDGATRFTKFGSADTLSLQFQEETP